MCIFQSVIKGVNREIFLHSVSDQMFSLFLKITFGVIISTLYNLSIFIILLQKRNSSFFEHKKRIGRVGHIKVTLTSMQ